MAPYDEASLSLQLNEGTESTLPPEETQNYLILDVWTGDGYRGLFKCIHLPDKVRQLLNPGLSWEARLSLIFIMLLSALNGPMKWFGNLLENTINLFLANGGIFKTLIRVLFFRPLVIRDKESANYVSFIGALDPRVALSSTKVSSNTIGTDFGSKFTADVFVMASKLAYENAKFVERVVTESWKMNFVGFYNCWNDFQKQNNTHVFLFTDRPENAKAIVVAFRGTEAFSADNWSTDFDFEWHGVSGDVGRVHLGFLESLGLGNRNQPETFVALFRKAGDPNTIPGLPDDDKKLAYFYVTRRVRELMAKNPDAKLFVTGHSLGGALTNLYTALLFHFKEDSITCRLGGIYTFGQPRVGDHDYCVYLIGKLREARYRRVVYSDDLVARIPFNDRLFEFKDCGYCYYYGHTYLETTLDETPDKNYFSWNLSNILGQRLGALYDLITAVFAGWIYGHDYRENILALTVRSCGLLVPGMTAHLLNNYVNSVRLGPPILKARLSRLPPRSLLGSIIFSLLAWWKKKHHTETA